MASCLVAAKVSSRATTKGAHQATITFLLVVRIGWAIGALRTRRALTIGLLALRVLLRGVGALLGELIVGSLARVLLLVLWRTVGTLLVVLIVWRGALAVLKSALCWGTVPGMLLE